MYKRQKLSDDFVLIEFYAELNKGAYLNDKSIQPSSSEKLSDCLLATGFPYLHDKKYDLSFKIGVLVFV